MPYHLSNKVDGCSGWAVVKDSDGKVMGCHKTKKEATDQLVALHFNEPETKKAYDKLAQEIIKATQEVVDDIRKELDEQDNE